MNRDEFYAAMAPHDDARLRKILWTVYWRGNIQLRERIEDELRPQDQPKVKAKKELPDPAGVLGEVTTFVELAKDGAYMAGDRRVHHTERSRWRHTFRRLAADALAALTASDPAPAQQAVAKIVDLACDMKRYDYFHSDDPVEAAKFVVSEAVAALWESVFRHGGFAALAGRAPEQLIRWEADYGWTRRGYGQVAEKETLLAVPLARLLTTPDMWRTFAESYLEALEAAGRADPKRPRTVYGTFDETSYRRKERADDLATWHEMLLDRFAGTPEDELLDRLVASPALAGPELIFLRARLAERRGDVSQAAALVTKCLKEMPGRQAYLDFAVKVGAELPSRAREIAADRRTQILRDLISGRLPGGPYGPSLAEDEGRSSGGSRVVASLALLADNASIAGRRWFKWQPSASEILTRPSSGVCSLARQVTAGRWRPKCGRFLPMPYGSPQTLPDCSRLCWIGSVCWAGLSWNCLSARSRPVPWISRHDHP